MWKYNGEEYKNDWKDTRDMVSAMYRDGILEDEKTGVLSLFDPHTVYTRMKDDPQEFEDAIKDYIIDKVADETPRSPEDGERYFGAVWHEGGFKGKIVITIDMDDAKDYEVKAGIEKAKNCVDSILNVSRVTNIKAISSVNSTGTVTIRVSKEE